MLVATYPSWKEIFGRRPTEEELLSEIKTLDRLHTIWLLARINILVKLSMSRAELLSIPDLQTFLVNMLIDEPLFQDLKRRYGREHLSVRQPFHSLQILTLMKKVALDGARAGGQRPDEEQQAAHRLGRCLIMTNDLLFSEESSRAIQSARPSTARKRIALQLQVGPGLEVNNPPEIASSIVRSNILFGELLGKVPCSLDIAGLFKQRTGLALEEYVDRIFGVMAWYTTVNPRELIEKSELASLSMSNFFAEAPKEATEKFWHLEVTTVDDLECILRKPSGLKPQHNFIPLRQRPFIQVAENNVVPVHVGFIQEKLEAGLFWRIFNSLKKDEERERFFSDWGLLFQEYISRIFSQSFARSPEQFYAFPKFADNGDEAFDGVVAFKNYWFVMEYKGGFIKSIAKYAEKEDEFIKEIERKFGNEKRAGMEQLARKVGAVFAAKPSQRRILNGIDSSPAAVVVPMLITQEPFASSEIIGPYLASIFGSLKRKQQISPKINCTPPLILDVSEVERLKPYLQAGKVSFMDCIMERVRLGSQVHLSFGDYFREYRKERSIGSMQDEDTMNHFRSIMNRVTERFFKKPRSLAHEAKV